MMHCNAYCFIYLHVDMSCTLSALLYAVLYRQDVAGCFLEPHITTFLSDMILVINKMLKC